MTPKEKAIELVDKMYGETPIMVNHTLIEYAQNTAKQCAIICVDEILQSHYVVAVGIKSSLYNYWFDVKLEIELL